MALIKCPECGKEISDKSSTCIHCGYPIQNEAKQYLQIESEAAICPECGSALPTSTDFLLEKYLEEPCDKCGSKRVQYHVINPPSIDCIEEYYEYYNNLVGGTINKELYMKWQNEFHHRMDEIMSRPTTPSCPYCNSVSTRKISTLSRAFSTGLFGLGSSKVGKQWHCNKCGSDF